MRKALVRSSGSLGYSQEDEDKRGHNLLVSSSEEEPRRRPRIRERRPHLSFNDFKVDIPEFEGKLDPDDFLEWMHIVERIIDFREIPKERTVKLVTPKLRKYTSL